MVRPVIMALFPAFAGVSEASGDGASKKGKHVKRVEKDTDEINGRFSGLGHGLFLCLSTCIPEFSAALQSLLGLV